MGWREKKTGGNDMSGRKRVWKKKYRCEMIHLTRVSDRWFVFCEICVTSNFTGRLLVKNIAATISHFYPTLFYGRNGMEWLQ